MAYEYDRFDDEAGGGGAFVMGLIAGAVLGAGLGMLLAPKPGSELRHQLGDQATRLRDRAAEGYTAASRKVSDASGKVSEMYNRTVGSTAGSTGTAGYSAGGVDTPSTSTEF
ncbi:MAG TPA: YtxH domain-containing protein [Vicinamibacterales bacterium]|nr:YtxH domain-containing protein [Vicinamibacterales bacterium]